MNRACETYEWERTGVCMVLVVIPEGKKLLDRSRRRWEYNIKMNLQEMGGVCGLERSG